MVTRFVNTDISGLGTLGYLNYFVNPEGGVVVDHLWVGRNGLVGSTGDSFTAIFGTGSTHRVHIEGAVAGYNGVHLGNNVTLDSGNAVVIASTGVVYGSNFGIVMFGIKARLDNFGLLSGGVYFNGNGPGLSRIANAGDIIHNLRAVFHEGSETLSLSNTGTIRGDIAAFFSTGTATIDLIRNRGEMTGDILLGGGDDRYDGRGGLVDGTVFGEAGNDTFRPGSGIELFDGGLGVDTLDFRSTSGVRVYLDESGVNTGTAEGDDYVGIENVQGSARGADVLVGDNASNQLFGYGGVDTLAGGNGADRLNGGSGADSLSGGNGDDVLFGEFGIDRLTGGLGNDSFYFEFPSEGGDVISDFGAVLGNDDFFSISRYLFGPFFFQNVGPLDPAYFQSRADNLAQDADDRFIFRTTDQTLWFDSNGNGAGGLLMVADLQSGAVVTAGDIFLY